MLQSGTAFRVYHGDPSDLPLELTPEFLQGGVWKLAGRATVDGIEEGRFEFVVIPASKVWALVDDLSAQVLALIGAHEPRFPMVDRETFRMGDGGDLRNKAFRDSAHASVAGEGEIIGIPRVVCSCGSREAAEPSIETVKEEVG